MSVCPADLRNPLRHLTQVIRKHDFEDIDHSDKTTPRQSWRPETKDWETLQRVCFFCWRDHGSPTTLYFATTCPSYNIQSHLLRSQNMEIKGKQKNFNEKMMKRGKKLVESRSQARAAFLLPQLSDIPMKAHKLTVALWSQRPKKKWSAVQKAFDGRAVATNVLKTFSIWELVESSFCLWERERERGEGKIERNLKYGAKASCF